VFDNVGGRAEIGNKKRMVKYFFPRRGFDHLGDAHDAQTIKKFLCCVRVIRI